MKTPLSFFRLGALAVCLAAQCALLPSLSADVPSLIRHQGRILVGNTNFSGTGKFRFALVNATGSVTYWSHDGTSAAGSQPSGSVNVTVDKGRYSVLLGDAALGMAALPATVFANGDVHLRIWFDDNAGTGSQLLTPDQRIVSVGYAMMAGNVSDGAITSAKIANGAVGTAQLATGAVGSTQLAPGAFSAAALAPGVLNAAGAFTWQTVTGTSQQAVSNVGYVAANNALTTFTLPAGPNVGDTFRVTGLGGGGWKVAQNAGQFVTTYNLGLPPGILWTQRDANRIWRCVASSADGLKLVAGSAAGIFCSTDAGATWTQREASRNYQGAASSADGTKLVMVVGNGQIYTSTDSGLSWTAREAARNWTCVTSSLDGSKLVAGDSGGNLYRSSDSGVSWTPADSARFWIGLASSGDGVKLVASVKGGQLYTSVNSGVTWTPRDSARDWRGVTSSADGAWLAAADEFGFLYTSADSGVTWTPRLTGQALRWYSVASSANGAKLAACVFQVGIENGRVYLSSDYGATWTPRGPMKNWRAVAMSADGHRIVGIGLDDNSAGFLYTSASSTTPGVSGYLSGGPGDSIELQYVGAGHWLPVSKLGDVFAF